MREGERDGGGGMREEGAGEGGEREWRGRGEG